MATACCTFSRTIRLTFRPYRRSMRRMACPTSVSGACSPCRPPLRGSTSGCGSARMAACSRFHLPAGPHSTTSPPSPVRVSMGCAPCGVPMAEPTTGSGHAATDWLATRMGAGSSSPWPTAFRPTRCSVCMKPLRRRPVVPCGLEPRPDCSADRPGAGRAGACRAQTRTGKCARLSRIG